MQRDLLPCFLPLLAALGCSTPSTNGDRYREPPPSDEVQEAGASAWNNPPLQPIPGVEHHTFHSEAMDTEVGYSILLPPGYHSSERRYAVTYWLHGVGGNEGEAPRPVARPMIEAMEAGTVAPMIIVFVNGAPATFFADSPDGRFLAETAFIRELIPHVDATYRTTADRTGRSIEGFSMGGFAALAQALKHPELFASVVAYAPALLDVQETAEGTLTLARVGGTHEGGNPPPPAAMLAKIFTTTFGGRREVFEACSPWALVRRSAVKTREDLTLRIVIGTDDGLWNANQLFHQLLLEHEWEHEFEIVNGIAHDIGALYERVGRKGLAFHSGKDELDRSDPESVGLSSTRLDRIDEALRAEIDTGRKAGAAVLIARRGKIAYLKAFGHAELEDDRPLRTDSYFRVYSMTKPVVSVALLTLYEEGKFQLTDPLEKYIPAMKDVMVSVGIDVLGNPVLEPPRRPIAIQDVFRHTAGFESQAGLDYGALDSLRELAEQRLPSTPLQHHPGERWVYSCAHDVQAYLVERFSGVAIDVFLKKRIFEPLGMVDSFYGEPPLDAPRRTVIYEQREGGELEPVVDPRGCPHEHFKEHPFGGAGLTMTLMDYARFAQMLLDGGQLDGTRILGRKTVELMTANHLPQGMETLFPGFGYGLGVAVCINPAESGNLGSVGQFGWGGAATTWVVIDPQEDLIALIFAQHMPSDSDFTKRLTTLVYQAIVD